MEGEGGKKGEKRKQLQFQMTENIMNCPNDFI